MPPEPALSLLSSVKRNVPLLSMADNQSLDLSLTEDEWDYEVAPHALVNGSVKAIQSDEAESDEDTDTECDRDTEVDLAQFPGLHIMKAGVTGFATIKRGDKDDIAFVVEVTWSDGTRHAVKRTYSDFCHFHYSLVEEYARKSNHFNESDSPIKLGYYLPAHVDRHDGKDDNILLAEHRELQLNKYVEELTKLPPQISACPMVLTFFESRNSDPKPYRESTDMSSEQMSDQYVLCWIDG